MPKTIKRGSEGKNEIIKLEVKDNLNDEEGVRRKGYVRGLICQKRILSKNQSEEKMIFIFLMQGKYAERTDGIRA